MRYDEAFEERWQQWPARGRAKIRTCERIWAHIFADKPEDQHEALLAAIDRGIAYWKASDSFQRGFVFSFERFLLEEEWRAVPAEVPAKPTDAPMPCLADLEAEERAIDAAVAAMPEEEREVIARESRVSIRRQFPHLPRATVEQCGQEAVRRVARERILERCR